MTLVDPTTLPYDTGERGASGPVPVGTVFGLFDDTALDFDANIPFDGFAGTVSADTAVSTDVLGLVVQHARIDTAAFVDTFIQTALSRADAATWADAVSEVLTDRSVVDSASALDQGALRALLSGSDSASATDALVGLAALLTAFEGALAGDSLTVEKTGGVILRTASDTGSLTDAAAIAAGLTATDVFVLYEAAALAATIAAAEAFASTDSMQSIMVQLVGSESAAAAESWGLVATQSAIDAAALLDNAALLEEVRLLLANDLGVLGEGSVSLVAALSALDTFRFLDRPRVRIGRRVPRRIASRETTLWTIRGRRIPTDPLD